MNNTKTRAAELKTSLDARSACASNLKGKLARLKAAQVEEILDTTRHIPFD